MKHPTTMPAKATAATMMSPWSRGRSGRQDDPELDLLVFGNRHKIKRSKLIETFDLEGLSNERIISVAQKEMAADQRLAEAKEAENHRPKAGAPDAPAHDARPDPTDQTGETSGPDADGLGPGPIPSTARPGRF